MLDYPSVLFGQVGIIVMHRNRPKKDVTWSYPLEKFNFIRGDCLFITTENISMSSLWPDASMLLPALPNKGPFLANKWVIAIDIFPAWVKNMSPDSSKEDFKCSSPLKHYNTFHHSVNSLKLKKILWMKQWKISIHLFLTSLWGSLIEQKELMQAFHALFAFFCRKKNASMLGLQLIQLWMWHKMLYVLFQTNS